MKKKGAQRKREEHREKERSIGKKVGAWENPENVGKRQSSENKSGVKEKGWTDGQQLCALKKRGS